MKNEKKFNKKALKKGSFALVISAVALAIVIVLNILVAQLPESVLHPDTTKTGLMSIGSETKDILSRLDTDIVITHYVDGSKTSTTETSNTNYISGILQRYAEASSHITVKTVDIVETNVQDKTVSQNMITDSICRSTSIIRWRSIIHITVRHCLPQQIISLPRMPLPALLTTLCRRLCP